MFHFRQGFRLTAGPYHDPPLTMSDGNVDAAKSFEPNTFASLRSDFHPLIHKSPVTVTRDRNILAEGPHSNQRLKTIANPDHQAAALSKFREIPTQSMLQLER